MRRIVSALVALWSAAAQAQPTACTEIGCVDGLIISPPLDYVWRPGAYLFDFLVDGRAIRCTGALPLKSCETQNIVCSAKGVTIMESGCALPPPEHGFGEILLPDGPRRITLKIRRDGRTIAQGDWMPAYRRTQPNGPTCSPVCRQAAVPLEMR